MTLCILDFFYHYIQSGVILCLTAGCCGLAAGSSHVASMKQLHSGVGLIYAFSRSGWRYINRLGLFSLYLPALL